MATLTLQPDGTAGKDSFIIDSTPTTNAGTNVNLRVGEENGQTVIRRGVIEFDLSSIPEGSQIVSAKLTLTLINDGDTYAANNRTLGVYRLLRDWVEAQVTWNIAKTDTNWGTAGASNTSTDRESSSIGSVTLQTTDSANDEKEITLDASKIKEMISGGGFTNNGFLLQMDSESNDLYEFASSDNVGTTKRPKLVIEYYLTGGNPMFFSGGGVTLG